MEVKVINCEILVILYLLAKAEIAIGFKTHAYTSYFVGFFVYVGFLFILKAYLEIQYAK